MKQRLLSCLFAAFQLVLASHVHAERADSDKEEVITSDNVVDDDVKGIRTWSGNVVVTQGTLILKGSKLVATMSPDGYQFAVMYAPANGLATMRQKRDGGADLWMEGEAADKITYDQKTSIAQLFSKAKVRRLTGTKPSDEAFGAFLSYNCQTEIVTGANTESGQSKPGAGRVTVVIQPHPHPDASSTPVTPANPPKDK